MSFIHGSAVIVARVPSGIAVVVAGLLAWVTVVVELLAGVVVIRGLGVEVGGAVDVSF